MCIRDSMILRLPQILREGRQFRRALIGTKSVLTRLPALLRRQPVAPALVVPTFSQIAGGEVLSKREVKEGVGGRIVGIIRPEHTRVRHDVAYDAIGFGSIL